MRREASLGTGIASDRITPARRVMSEHDLVGKPVSTFPDDALTDRQVRRMPMKLPRRYFQPLASGAPQPYRELPVRLERMIHFGPPHL
jgi:hypothetical protein